MSVDDERVGARYSGRVHWKGRAKERWMSTRESSPEGAREGWLGVGRKGGQDGLSGGSEVIR